MPILTKIVSSLLSARLRAIDRFKRNPIEVQHNQFVKLVQNLAATPYGVACNIEAKSSLADFQKNIPVNEYDNLRPTIEEMVADGQNRLWTSPARWYAKSSGTTSERSKFIPISSESLYNCHYRGTRDVVALHLASYPSSNIFSGKTLTLGGSHKLEGSCGAMVGDLSAILIENTPFVASFKRAPSKEIALMPDFEAKVAAICKTAASSNITAFAGVPSWNLVLLNAILDYTGKSNIYEVWPNIELFMHGGVSFLPYREIFEKIIPSPKMKYIETYNASEGFFAIQDNPADSAMLLMLDYEVFYEFLEVDKLDSLQDVVSLEGVRLGVNYAMMISTSGGLWRYLIGDTVQFTSLEPYRIKITGRTKQFINVFGEELMVDNAERAVAEASAVSSCVVRNYTVAPIFMQEKSKGGHQWLIEFEKEPADYVLFANTLDAALRRVNSDYDAKRTNNSTLDPPKIVYLKSGSFYEWMRSNGKLGGQHKIPRLSSSRKYVDELLAQGGLSGLI